MAIFLSLAPFGAFSLLLLLTTAAASASAAAAVAILAIIHDIVRGNSIKIFAAGTVLMFGAMAIYFSATGAEWSDLGVRIAVDLGVIIIALFSLAVRVPFTLQYARESVDAETRALPAFVTANYVMTWVWAAAAALMLVANLTMIYLPSAPLWLGLAIVFGLRNAALWFTNWYPDHLRHIQDKRTAAQTPAPAR
ncbi:MAG: hypothetical protein ACOY4O_02635 [Pseudomonadota bacterium]|jgi:hypothetical protein